MVYLLSLLGLGLLTGFLIRLRNKSAFLHGLENLFVPVLAIMIFCLAFSITQQITKLTNFFVIGRDSILIAFSGMIGSIIAATSLTTLFSKRIVHIMCSINQTIIPERRHRPLSIGLHGSLMKLSWVKTLRCNQALSTSILLSITFIAGILISVFKSFTLHLQAIDFLRYATLGIIMLLVGITLGGERRLWRQLRKTGPFVVALPIAIIIGTLLGVTLTSGFLQDITLVQALSISSGLGFYSITSSVITSIAGPVVGLAALLSNFSREVLTILLIPLITKTFGPLSAIASGGATSANSTLAMISLSCGKEYVTVALCSGLILTLLVPIMVSGIIKMAF